MCVFVALLLFPICETRFGCTSVDQGTGFTVSAHILNEAFNGAATVAVKRMGGARWYARDLDTLRSRVELGSGYFSVLVVPAPGPTRILVPGAGLWARSFLVATAWFTKALGSVGGP